MTSPASKLDQFLAEVRGLVDDELTRLLADEPGEGDPGRLREAMRYAVLGGGKRLRPALAIAAAEACATDRAGVRARALPAAAALEMLHAYTLVHDDLPAMDDDVERRGRPTVHVAFGEATAILAGDGLLTAAFGALAALGGAAADAVRVLARRSGAHELLEGQARDLAVQGALPTEMTALEEIHARKTGALFAAAAELGAIVAGADAGLRARLGAYGMSLGIAFQHADDLADGDQPALAAAALARLTLHLEDARGQIAPLGARAEILAALADRVGASV